MAVVTELRHSVHCRLSFYHVLSSRSADRRSPSATDHGRLLSHGESRSAMTLRCTSAADDGHRVGISVFLRNTTVCASWCRASSPLCRRSLKTTSASRSETSNKSSSTCQRHRRRTSWRQRGPTVQPGTHHGADCSIPSTAGRERHCPRAHLGP